jgi:hypothetical protein
MSPKRHRHPPAGDIAGTGVDDGGRFCNTEVLTFEGEKLRKVEVYFGWDL